MLLTDEYLIPHYEILIHYMGYFSRLSILVEESDFIESGVSYNPLWYMYWIFLDSLHSQAKHNHILLCNILVGK